MQGPSFSSADLTADLAKLLASPDICSKQWIWRQYDYMVRTNTLAGPGGDAAIVRVKETGSSIAISLDGNGRYCYLSPREGVMLNVAECCRNLVGGWRASGRRDQQSELRQSRAPRDHGAARRGDRGMSEACRFFDTPITGGNVSLYNETLGEGIFPTPVMGIVGTMPTAAPVTIDFKNAGRAVVLLGGLGSADEVRFGGTQYAKTVLNNLWGLPPALDLEYEKRVQAAAARDCDLGIGGIGARHQRWRTGGRVGRIVVWPGRRRRGSRPRFRSAAGIVVVPRRVDEFRQISSARSSRQEKNRANSSS